MKNMITGKVLMKRNGGLKAYQYELDGKVLRKSQRYYPLGFYYPKSGKWTFGKTPSSWEEKFDTGVCHVVEWEVTQKEANHLPPVAPDGSCRYAAGFPSGASDSPAYVWDSYDAASSGGAPGYSTGEAS